MGPNTRDDEIQPGLVAHASPPAWLLFHETWTESFPSGLGNVRIPHPLGYVAQKIIVGNTSRPLDKRGKDFHDALYVLAGLSERWPEIFKAHKTLSSYDPDGQSILHDAHDTWKHLFIRASGVSVGASLISSRLETEPKQRDVIARMIDVVSREAFRSWSLAMA